MIAGDLLDLLREKHFKKPEVRHEAEPVSAQRPDAGGRD